MLNRLNPHISIGKKIITLLAVTSLLFFVACEDRSDLVAPSAPNTGTADFTRFVSLGNSLTSGYQNASLYESSQMYSFVKLIANQVGTSFEQPIISGPGIPGKLELHGFDDNHSPIIIPNSGLGAPTNTEYAAPYNNLGVPGAILYDLIDETDLDAKYVARGNPYFKIVMRDQSIFGASLVKQALALNPTFMTLWIGNNDVLGYATSGGTRGTDPATGTLPTDVPTFTFLYNQVATAITDPTGGRKIAAANIPDVQNIPFFTTIGPKIGAALIDVIAANPAVVGLFYQKAGETVASSYATPEDLIAATNILLTLSASPYAGLIGRPTGKFYRDNGIPLPAGIDTTQAFGLHPQNPWPNVFTLDADEIAVTKQATSDFNGIISNTVNANKDTWVLVDINSFFADLKAAENSKGGMIEDGIKFSTYYILGNTFSLDGVHPTTQGYGVIANVFIKAINSKFNASIPRINVSTLPASIPVLN